MSRNRVRFLSASDAVTMLRVVGFFLWPITTLAASQSLGDAMYGIGFKDWVSVFLLTSVSGLVALLTRVRKSLEAAALLKRGDDAQTSDLQLIPWWFFAVIHMAGAMFVGALAFFVCQFFDLNSYLEAPVIALVSWGGAKRVDKWADSISDGLADKITALIGKRA
jgi:hypothetical protein